MSSLELIVNEHLDRQDISFEVYVPIVLLLVLSSIIAPARVYFLYVHALSEKRRLTLGTVSARESIAICSFLWKYAC